MTRLHLILSFFLTLMPTAAAVAQTSAAYGGANNPNFTPIKDKKDMYIYQTERRKNN